ncbi:MAG: FAD-dependent oxidoreductase [Nanoarchaeota archaeon]|nr:FAD-dependent oxidoreductase [Nanoarchaeota archaeon]
MIKEEKKKEYETIIIGGGISGLSCAKKLNEAGKDFLLISKNFGGRMCTPKKINYGACYVTGDYKHILNYVDKKEKLKLKDTFFLHNNHFLKFLTLKNLKYIFKIIKGFFILKNFRKHVLKLIEQLPYKSVKEGIEEDSLLFNYFKMPAKEFIRKHGFEELSELYFSPLATCTTFIDINKLSTYYYLSCFFPMIVNSYISDFKNTSKKLLKNLEDKAKIGLVIKVKKIKNGKYKIKTNIGDFYAKNIVFAALEKELKGVYNLPKPKIQQPIYVFYVNGKRKKRYMNKRAIIFNPKESSVYLIMNELGYETVYSKNLNPDFDKYYEKNYKIKRFYWNVAMPFSNNLIDQKLEENVYLASDYNIPGLEYSFLSGLYAANQIINLG